MPASQSLSPYFAGRQTEMALLLDTFGAVVRSHENALVWIGGEAGVGKTRLVREFLKRIDDQALCVTGIGIAQSESGLPYAPFTGALRHLIRELGLEFVNKRVGFSFTNALALLLPEFGESPVGDPAILRARMFEGARKLLEVASATRPVVLVLEDMHWADAGSRDLLRFLAANLANNRIIIVATYRPENDDGAAAASLAADQARSGRGLFVVLPRLTRREISDQLEGLLGYLPCGELVAKVFQRGAGVPLFTEAMIDRQGKLRERLPESIRGLMAGTLEELPDQTVRLLQAMATGGLTVSPLVLAKVMGIPSEEVGGVSKPAIEAQVLSVDDGSLAFRHALFRDAIADQMLASDTARLHAAYAAALEDEPDLCPATWVSMARAHHWRGAGDCSKAIAAAWNAAQEARRQCAYDEQLQMLEIVLEMWDKLPDAGARLGVSHLRLLEEATDTACWAAEPTKGLAYASQALADLEEIDDTDKTVAFLLQRAILRQQQLLPGEMKDLMRAESLATKRDPLRAETLGQLSRALIARRQLAEARPYADELFEVAAAIGNQEFALEASLIAAHLDALADAKADPLPPLIRQVQDAGLWRLETIGYLAQLDVLSDRSAYREIVRIGLPALERAAKVGQGRYVGPALSQAVADGMIMLGEWDGAQAIIDRALDMSPAPLGRIQLLQSVAWIACARGQTTMLRNIVQEVRSFDTTARVHRQRAWRRLELEIGLALLTGDRDAAIAESAAVPAYLDGERSEKALPVLCAAARVLQSVPAERAALDDVLAKAAPILRSCGGDQPFARLFLAEGHCGPSEHALSLWGRASEAFAKAGYPFYEAYCAYRYGLTVAESGRRTDAAKAVRRAAELARALGCKPLLDDISQLAQRARVKLPIVSHTELGDAHELTDRELQVLRLVAVGKRNRDIAKELFISPKTASIHVSNILTKLNVKTRGAAAAAAHRLRLVEAS